MGWLGGVAAPLGGRGVDVTPSIPRVGYSFRFWTFIPKNVFFWPPFQYFQRLSQYTHTVAVNRDEFASL